MGFFTFLICLFGLSPKRQISLPFHIIPTLCTGMFFGELASSSLAAERYPRQLGSWQGVQLFLHNRDNANRLFHNALLILSFVPRHMKSDEELFWKSALLAVNLEGN